MYNLEQVWNDFDNLINRVFRTLKNDKIVTVETKWGVALNYLRIKW